MNWRYQGRTEEEYVDELCRSEWSDDGDFAGRLFRRPPNADGFFLHSQPASCCAIVIQAQVISSRGRLVIDSMRGLGGRLEWLQGSKQARPGFFGAAGIKTSYVD
jgi:hypothetical protein